MTCWEVRRMPELSIDKIEKLERRIVLLLDQLTEFYFYLRDLENEKDGSDENHQRRT